MGDPRSRGGSVSVGLLAGLAILLTLPALSVGLLLDDYHHKLLMQAPDSPVSLARSWLDLFRFIDGDPEQTARLTDYGLLPWWTYPGIKAAFLRPLASLTHWLDYRLWPETPALMHVQSLLWFGALVAAVGVAYRRFMGFGAAATLAGLLYTVDDAHATPALFLANRNALLATLFGALALLAHDRWRREHWRAGAVLGPIWVAAALLSAEGGIAVGAYLLAHALFIDKAPWRSRIAALIPYAALVLAWRCVWTALGYGVANLGLYIDPLTEPIRFASAVCSRFPILLLAQWAGLPAEIHVIMPDRSARWLGIGAGLFLLVLALVLAPLVRRDRIARFWAVGMVLSVVPVCATNPSDRLLLFPGIGAMGLLGRWLSTTLGKGRTTPVPARRRKLTLPLAYAFVLIHLVIAPVMLPIRSAYPLGPRSLTGSLAPIPPMDHSITQQDLIIVNPPVAFFMIGSPLVWASEHQPLPRHLRVLTSSLFEDVRVSRPDAYTLVVRPQAGYLTGAMDQLFRSDRHPLARGRRIALTGMTVEITELHPDGRPAEAAFRFAVPLEHPSLRWLQWKDRQFAPFAPPPIGQTADLPGSHRLPAWLRPG